MQVERRHLGGLDHVANRDLFRGTRERVSAASPSRALDEAGATHAKQNLLHIVTRQALHFRDLAAGDRTLGRASREVERADHAVLGECSYAHASKLAGGWGLGD